MWFTRYGAPGMPGPSYGSYNRYGAILAPLLFISPPLFLSLSLSPSLFPSPAHTGTTIAARTCTRTHARTFPLAIVIATKLATLASAVERQLRCLFNFLLAVFSSRLLPTNPLQAPDGSAKDADHLAVCEPIASRPAPTKLTGDGGQVNEGSNGGTNEGL